MMEAGRIEVLGGANLPMLVKLAQMRDVHTLEECATAAEQAAHKYISRASHLPQQCLDGARRCSEGAAGEPIRILPSLSGKLCPEPLLPVSLISERKVAVG